MKKWHILNAESIGYSRKAYSILSEIGVVEECNLSREELIEKINPFEILIIRLNNKIDSEIIEKADNLKFIVSATTGTNHIDISYATQRGIELITLQGEQSFLESIPSTAEHTWGLVLSLLRKSNAAFRHVQEGGWDRKLFIGNNISGKKFGILGLGRVGKQVARYALAFGCVVGSYDIKPEARVYGVKAFTSAADLFSWADIISIHIPYDYMNHHFVDTRLLSCINKGLFLINTSRGGVWDEDAVVAFVQNGYLGGVATDVLYDEYADKYFENPLVQSSLTRDNFIITPHIAGATVESMEMTEIFVAKKLYSRILNKEIK